MENTHEISVFGEKENFGFYMDNDNYLVLR